MIDYFTRYWYLIVGIAIGLFALGIFWMLTRPSAADRPRVVGFLMFGPFWPMVDGYMTRRGSLTRRELIGWAVVVLIMILAIVFGPRRGA